MIRVYSATIEEHLATALDPYTRVYNKALVPKSRCPGGDIDASIVQAALFYFMAGHKMVVLSGLVPESQLKTGQNADYVVGLQLTVDQIFSIQLVA